MQAPGTAITFNSLYQVAGGHIFLKKKTFEEMMISRNFFDSYESVILGENALKKENSTDSAKKRRYLEMMKRSGLYK